MTGELEYLSTTRLIDSLGAALPNSQIAQIPVEEIAPPGPGIEYRGRIRLLHVVPRRSLFDQFGGYDGDEDIFPLGEIIVQVGWDYRNRENSSGRFEDITLRLNRELPLTTGNIGNCCVNVHREMNEDAENSLLTSRKDNTYVLWWIPWETDFSEQIPTQWFLPKDRQAC